jgi:hypothetical protein
MKDWIARHTFGFQAMFFGVVIPPLMWAATKVFGSGWAPPRDLVHFIAYWLLLGLFSGLVYYGVQRTIAGVMRPSARSQ